MVNRLLVLYFCLWVPLGRGLHLPLVKRYAQHERLYKRDGGASGIGIGDFLDV
jgi:hypothetical protein